MARGLAVAVVAVALLAAAPAAATEHVVTQCSNLQPTIDGAQAGDVVTLSVSCTGSWDLKSFATPFAGIGPELTIRGAGAGAVLTGDGSNRIFTGNDIRLLQIQNLSFRGGRATGAGEDGGAIDITGHSGLQVFDSAFFDNDAADQGGAIHFADEQPPAENNIGVSIQRSVFGSTTVASDGNSAATGGAVSVESAGRNDQFSLGDNTFGKNTATGNGGAFHFDVVPGGATNVSINGNQVIDNSAGGSGGGGHVVLAQSIFGLSNELYQSNSLAPRTGGPAGVAHLGGGLYVEAQNLASPDLTKNRFAGNTVASFADGDSGGGALAFVGDNLNVDSQYSRIEGNSVGGQPDADFESEGGGLFIEGDGSSYYGFLDAIAANTVGSRGVGGGVYTGAATDTTLEFGESTVAGNSVGQSGQFAGVAGNGQDNLILRNSVIFNGPADIGGFDDFDVQFSDACNGGSPFAGPGNICADPKLAGAADVHQTKASPTIDAGSDALFMSEGGERELADFEGDPRPTDGDGDGHTVDMGADETPAGFSAPPPPPPPPPPATPQCSDQVDNDSDGAIDLADPGCLPGPTDNNEGDETERDLVLCGERVISLVRADLRGRRVVLSGIVAASVAGQKVELSVRFLDGRGKAEKLGSVTPGADGKFQARVKRPPRNLFNVARYRAQVGNARSVELKLPQSLASSSLRAVGGGTLELRGQVDRKLLGKRNAVVVKRILCGKYTTVGQAKPNRRGAYVVRFPAPATTGGAALYRAESRVLAKPGSKRYVKQFARALGITF
jgi:hypothetical protein